jgi:quinol monooxygenase YgiN
VSNTLGNFALVVRFTVRSGAEAAFDELTHLTMERIRTEEPGTLVYICHGVEGSPRQRIFYELYRDRTAFQEHESKEHVKFFLAKREAMLEATEVDFLSPAVGKVTTNEGGPQ